MPSHGPARPRRTPGTHRTGGPRRLSGTSAGIVTAALVTGVVVVGGTLALTGSPGEQARDTPPGLSSPRSGGTPESVTTLEAQPARRVGSVRPERPTVSRLPNGTRVAIRAAGNDAGGSLAVPKDIRIAGWWRGGSRLGDPFGVTLLAAHVDSVRQGLGPYASLLSVRYGQRITVASPHLAQTFGVVSLRLVRRSTLARHHELFSARGARRLVLVTCAPPYDKRRGGYQNLAVVTSVPITDVHRRGRP
jgi:hypothetical protein